MLIFPAPITTPCSGSWPRLASQMRKPGHTRRSCCAQHTRPSPGPGAHAPRGLRPVLTLPPGRSSPGGRRVPVPHAETWASCLQGALRTQNPSAPFEESSRWKTSTLGGRLKATRCRHSARLKSEPQEPPGPHRWPLGTGLLNGALAVRAPPASAGSGAPASRGRRRCQRRPGQPPLRFEARGGRASSSPRCVCDVWLVCATRLSRLLSSRALPVALRRVSTQTLHVRVARGLPVLFSSLPGTPPPRPV